MFEAACCISACERRTRATSIYLQCNAGIAQIDLFPTLLPMKLGENLELVEDFKSHAHTHAHTCQMCTLLTVHPDIPVRDTWLHAARMSCWPGPHWGAELKARVEDFETCWKQTSWSSSVSHFSMSWAEHVASLFEIRGRTAELCCACAPSR